MCERGQDEKRENAQFRRSDARDSVSPAFSGGARPFCPVLSSLSGVSLALSAVSSLTFYANAEKAKVASSASSFNAHIRRW